MTKKYYIIAIISIIIVSIFIFYLTSSDNLYKKQLKEQIEIIIEEIDKLEMPVEKIYMVGLEINNDVYRFWNYQDKTDEIYMHYYKYFRALDGNAILTRKIFVIIMDACRTYGIPLHQALSLAYTESKFDPLVTCQNRDSIDRGLFQLNSLSFPGHAEKLFFDPEWNTEQAFRLLIRLQGKYKTLVEVLGAYHQGIQDSQRALNYAGLIIMRTEFLDRHYNENLKI